MNGFRDKLLRTHGRTDGRTDERTDGQTNGGKIQGSYELTFVEPKRDIKYNARVIYIKMMV